MQGTRKEEGSVTKSDLIETVAQKLHLPKGKAELIVNCVFDSMEESLKQGRAHRDPRVWQLRNPALQGLRGAQPAHR